jgi:hypothetical protein
MNVFDIFRTLADIALLPLLGSLWNIQGRLSKIEGMLHSQQRRFDP